MLKLYALAAAFLIVGGSLYDFPKACYSHAFNACVSAQASSLSHGYTVDWNTVDAIRTFK